MDERDDSRFELQPSGLDEPSLSVGSEPLPPQEKRSAGEQAGPATWSDRVPAGGAGAAGGEEPRGRAQNVAQKAAEKATEFAQGAGQQVQEAVGRRKDETAERIAKVAEAVRQAARSLDAQDPALPRYFEAAADRLQRASGYLRDRDARAMLRETEQFARRRPELFLAGSVLAGLAIARFLKSSARRPHETTAEAPIGEL